MLATHPRAQGEPRTSFAWAQSSVLLLAATAVLRSASLWFWVINLDESDFALIARRMVHGAWPYVGAVDIKPPLTYLAFLPSAVGSPRTGLWLEHAVGIAWLWATCLLLRAAARAWTGNELAGWVAAWLGLLASLCEVPSVSSELLMNLPVAAALLFWVRALREGRNREAAGAGLCVGLSMLFRHQGGAMLIGFCAWALARELRRRTLGLQSPALRRLSLQLSVLVSAAAVPGLLAWALWAAFGHGAAFWDWVVLRNLHYAGGGGGGSALRRLLQTSLLCGVGTLLPWALALRELWRPGPAALGWRAPIRSSLAYCLVATALAVAAGGRFYEHYFLQFAPLLALLGAPRGASLLRRWPTLLPAPRALLGAAALLPALGAFGYAWARGALGGYPDQDPQVRAVARFVRQATGPSDRIFVWGHASPIYLLADRSPSSRYLTCSVHVGNFDPAMLPSGYRVSEHLSQRDLAATVADLRADKPALILDTSPADLHGFGRMPLSATGPLWELVQAQYVAEAEVAGVRVYRRRAGF